MENGWKDKQETLFTFELPELKVIFPIHENLTKFFLLR